MSVLEGKYCFFSKKILCFKVSLFFVLAYGFLLIIKFKVFFKNPHIFCSTLCWKQVCSVFCSFFDIHYPDVFVTAEQGGNLTIRVNKTYASISCNNL